MTDVTPEPATRKPRKGEVIEDAVIVEETPQPVVVDEPIVVDEVDDAPPAREVIYVQTPQPPRKLGNRGVGAAIAVASAVVFAAALALATAIIGFLNTGGFRFAFLTDPKWYIPVLFFVIGFVLLVLIANRAAWWAYIFGSILVGVFVYFGSIGLALLSSGVILQTPEQAAAAYAAQLGSPFIIVAALLARETSLWVGSVIARRGRSVKARNAEARAAHEREMDEKKAEGERAAL